MLVFIFLLILSNICFAAEIKPQIIEYQNTTVIINVSKTQANRIVLPDNIISKVDSKEKGLEVTVTGKQAFAKFSPTISTTKIVSADNKNSKIKGQKTLYNNNKPVELYLLTKNKTYEFVLAPKNIPKQTIIIRDSLLEKEQNKKSAKSFERSTSYQKQINKLIYKTFNNLPLKGFEKKNTLNIVANTSRLEIIKKTEFIGNKYKINLYTIKNKLQSGVEIVETALIPLVKDNIYAISIFYNNDVYKIPPYGKADAIIITENNLKE